MRAVPGDIVAGAMMLWTLGSVPISTSSNSSVQAACASAGGGLTPTKSDCQFSLEKGSRVDITVGVDGICFRLEGDIVRVFGAVTFDAFGDDVKSRVEAEDVAIFIGAKEKRLVELFGLELEALETLILEL
eukprot:774948-Pleurochrysis_carterae.AAC.1